MTTLEERLSALGNALDDHYGPITQHELTNPAQRSIDDLTVDYLQQRPDESDALPNQKRWRGAVMAVAAAILVVVGVVVVADGNGGDVVTDPASTPTVTDPLPPAGESDTDPPVSVTDSLVYRWSRVPNDQDFGGGVMDGVAAGGPGLVAVGSDSGAAVWTSVDGVSWSRVPHDNAVFGGAGSGMTSVTAGGPGLVAVGVVPGGVDDDENAAVWTSVDGISWSRVPHDEAVFGGPGKQGMSDVVVGGPGVVAVGWDGDLHAGTLVAAVWTSVDGLSWSRVPHDEAVFGGARNQTMSSVTAGGPGLVAVGAGGGDPDAVVWTSVDGLVWSRVPHDEAVFGGADQYMTSVTAGGPGLVAVGFGIAPDNSVRDLAMVWTSTDGLTWSRVPHDEALFGDGFPKSVTATSRGLVVVGDLDLWTSPDGFSWSRGPQDEAVFGEPGQSYIASNHMNSVVAAGPGVVAVGQAPGGPAVWVGVADN
jgi:hypothetical protein